MNSIERLKNEYDIRTHIEGGKVTFVGPGICTDYYRRSRGKCPAWPEISQLMADAERTAKANQ